MLNGLLLFILFGFESAPTGRLLSYSIKDNSTITLSGSSNVNSFECTINSNLTNGYLSVNADKENGAVNFHNALLKINVSSFDCKNPIMSRDLQKTLRADKYPLIEAELITATPFLVNSKPNASRGKIKTSVAITISGKCRIIDLVVEWQMISATEYRFVGSKQLLMSDFDIAAPSAAFGLIKVNNDIVINFDFTIQTSPSEKSYQSLSELLSK
jgi:hypothetical protein